MSDSIAVKCTKLGELLSDNVRTDNSWRLCRQALLDGFLVLFDECGTEHMQRDKHIAGFVNKYKEDVKSLRNTRPSISDFKVVSTIGRGHFGQVQVVKELQTDDVYAMKTLKKSEMLSQENVAFFEEEKDIMAYGQSPWITSLHYAFQDAQNLHLVMEFHPGGDLLTLLGKQENEVLEEKAARFYLAEIVLALKSLHDLGYVHRDVKPDNILVDKHGHIKLADFGSAAKLSNTDKKVYSKMAVGTPEYISPEVLTSMEGSGGGYGVECDWWSLGIIAYEMVYGNPPFSGASVAVTYSKIMNYKESLEFPCDVHGSVSLKSLIKGLLTDTESRLGYDELIKHAFFKEVTWTSLENEQPPYIPIISGVDDTSNFDEFEAEEPISFGTSKIPTKKSFSGKDLPFVGFTFTKPNKMLKSSTSSPTEALSQSLETKENGLTPCDGKNDAENERLILKKMVDELQQLLDTRKGTIESLESEKDLLEKERMLKEIEIKDLKKHLDVERTERNNADNRALKLFTEVETIRKKAHNLRKEETRETFDEQQDVLTQLEEDRFIAMKRTQRLQDEFAAQQKIVEEKNAMLIELQQTVDEFKEQLTKKSDNDVVEVLSHLRHVQADGRQCCSPVARVRQLQAARRQSSPLTCSPHGTLVYSQRVEEISNKIMEAIMKCQEKEKSDLKRMRERLKAKTDQCSELETQLLNSKSLKRKLQKADDKVAEVGKENHALSNAIKKMEKEVEETFDKMYKLEESTGKEISSLKDTSQTAVRNTGEKDEKLKDSNTLILKLNDDLQHAQNETKSTLDKNKELQQAITKLTKEGEAFSKMNEELEQELKQKVSLIGNLLKNELTVKAAMKDDEIDPIESNLNVKSLEAEILTLNDKNSEIESENKELNGQVNKLMGKCERLIASKEELEKELQDKIQVIGRLDSVVRPSKVLLLKESIGKDSEEVQDMKAEIIVINDENKELKNKNKDLKSQLRKLTEDFAGLNETSKSCDVQLESKTKQLTDCEKTISMLKTTCTMLEGQIEELEILNDELDEKNIQLEIEIKHLLLSNEKYQQATLEQEMEKENDSVSKNEELDENKLIKERSETIAEQENQLKISELNLKSLERKMEKVVIAKKKLLDEIEKQKTSIASLETVNSKLTEELQEIKERHEEILNENSSMAEHLDTLKSMHAEEKIKLVSTSAQQSKLIDFLQSKAESKASKRKRHGVSNLISSWKHQDDSNFIPFQWNELHQTLEKERTSRTKLQNELNKIKEELENSKEKTTYWKARCHVSSGATLPRSNQSMAVLSALQQSPSRQPSPGTALTPNVGIKRKGSTTPGDGTHRPKERMHHNIPHRFNVVLNMRATKCPVCLDGILFGRQVSKCTECGVLCHCKCSLSLQHTCGLPSQYMEHFSEALLGPKTETSLLGTPGDEVFDGKNQHLQGWLKVPRNGSAKNGWDKKWVVLSDEKLLISETTDENDQCDEPSDTLILSGEECKVKVHSAVVGTDLVGSATTDLPYVFSIETLSKTTCWPHGRTMFLLAPSFPEKQKWVRALENVVNEPKDTASSQVKQKVNGNVLLRMKGNDCLDINCTAVLNDKFVLLGAEEGLFLLSVAKPGKNNIPRQIPGVRNVFQIHIERDLGLALLISGNERELLCVDIKLLEACTKQSREVPLTSLTFQQVENITNCHLFALKKVEEGTFLCAALPNKISVLRFNSSMNSFVIRKEIDSSEPCSCILFSKSQIIVGSNKFYQIDLGQFTLNDFLDCKDTSLAFAVYHASQANSFPIDILQVSQPNSSDEEFLLCFNGFGVFVNSSGKRTRKDDLKWTGLPLSFAYQEPYLFVTHFNSMEICNIPAINTNNQESICHRFIEITRPRILGHALSPGAIYLVSTFKDEIDMLCYQGNLAPVLPKLEQNSSCSDSETTMSERHRRKRVYTPTGCENVAPSNSLSAISRNPKRFLRSSFRF